MGSVSRAEETGWVWGAAPKDALVVFFSLARLVFGKSLPAKETIDRLPIAVSPSTFLKAPVRDLIAFNDRAGGKRESPDIWGNVAFQWV